MRHDANFCRRRAEQVSSSLVFVWYDISSGILEKKCDSLFSDSFRQFIRSDSPFIPLYNIVTQVVMIYTVIYRLDPLESYSMFSQRYVGSSLFIIITSCSTRALHGRVWPQRFCYCIRLSYHRIIEISKFPCYPCYAQDMKCCLLIVSIGMHDVVGYRYQT